MTGFPNKYQLAHSPRNLGRAIRRRLEREGKQEKRPEVERFQFYDEPGDPGNPKMQNIERMKIMHPTKGWRDRRMDAVGVTRNSMFGWLNDLFQGKRWGKA